MKWFILSFVLISDQSIAAPIPATSSSSLISADTGLYFSSHGFSIHAGPTGWIQTAPPKHITALETLYRAPKMDHGVQASLTVRVDDTKDMPTLKGYVRRWLKDYRRLGFDVLASKPVLINGQEAYLVDVINQESQKQLRQVVLVRQEVAVIMTCRDHKENFSATLKTCHSIMRNFRWIR